MAKTSDMFNIVERDGLRLITPTHDASVANAGWNRENLHYRSRIETLDGATVSQGFKKFFNLGQGPDGLRIDVDDVMKSIDNHDAIATLKLDGSLLIRSVYQGKVMFRTRGSFGYEFLNNAREEMDYFYRGYRKLWHANLYDSLSLLFEWTTPSNQIVLKYDKPELTLIGAIVNIDTPSYIRIPDLQNIADLLEVPLVEYFKLDAEGWKALYDTLETNTKIEGYVIRIHGEQDLVKVKCAPYITKHALKSSLTSEGLVDMFIDYGRPTFQGFVEQFKNAFDEETCMWAYGAICALYDGINEYKKIIGHMAATATRRKGWTRKDVALTGLNEYGQTKRFSAYMKVWEGAAVPKDLEKSIILQNTKQVELGMFKTGGNDDN